MGNHHIEDGYSIDRPKCVPTTILSAQEPSKNSLDHVVPKNAQEGYFGGSRKETNSPHSQAPARHRRCHSRRDQGAPSTMSRSPSSCPSSRHQGIQGEEGRAGEQEEG